MLHLYWNYDSPYSRCIKWLLLHLNIEHQQSVLTWAQMTQDEGLFAANPKRQVPTLTQGSQSRSDSLLIAMDHLPADWYQSIDAKLYRLADAEVEAAIIFLFRARMLKQKFGDSPQADLMLDAGINTYRFAVDLLLEHYWPQVQAQQQPLNVGAVLLFSTFLAAHSMMPAAAKNYKAEQLQPFIDWVESDSTYRQMISQYQQQPTCEVSFRWAQ